MFSTTLFLGALIGVYLVRGVAGEVSPREFPLAIESSVAAKDAEPQWAELPMELGPEPGRLLLAHRWVKERWSVELGGVRLGQLDQIEQSTWSVFSVPRARKDIEGRRLRLRLPKANDRIEIHAVRWIPNAREDWLSEAGLAVTVRDDQGHPLPARITVMDEAGFLVPLQVTRAAGAYARRTGVVYQVGGSCVLGLEAGRYRIVVHRGPEYERAVVERALEPGTVGFVPVVLARSVATEGWVSCDPHTHTFTYSRHGDATTEERVVTFAGEAIEWPIATDHNTLTDYREAASATGTDGYFTPVIGDEVTTKEAHFNVFPVAADARLPDFRILDWKRLIAHFRQVPELRVVVLNHPHNVHNGFRPFDRAHLNPVTGRILKKLDGGVDAMELLSSSAQQSDLMLVFRDWFALLNQGHRIVGLGSSDVHDVNRYIIGQGRTYVRGADQEVGALDTPALCEALVRGEALVSMGLFVDLQVNENGRVGDIVPVDDTVSVRVTVRAPSWIRADRVELFANGVRVRSRAVSAADWVPNRFGGWESTTDWRLEGLAHDTYLVAMATGPGDLDAAWPIPYPYQPSSDAFVPRVAGATNPVWLDRDGDARFASSRELGEAIWRDGRKSDAALARALGKVDQAVAIQVADIAHRAGRPLWDELSVLQAAAESRSLRLGLAAVREYEERVARGKHLEIR